jgi:hypothetical protein
MGYRFNADTVLQAERDKDCAVSRDGFGFRAWLARAKENFGGAAISEGSDAEPEADAPMRKLGNVVTSPVRETFAEGHGKPANPARAERQFSDCVSGLSSIGLTLSLVLSGLSCVATAGAPSSFGGISFTLSAGLIFTKSPAKKSFLSDPTAAYFFCGEKPLLKH